MTHAGRDWTVLLIGGSSGTGKTTVAEQVGRRLGVPWAQVDDFRLALQHVTSPGQQPALHFFVREPGVARDGIWAQTPETLCQGLIGLAQVVSAALDVVIGHHLATNKPIVLEGDGILPALAARHTSVATGASSGVRGVFLVETDEAALLAAMAERGRGYTNGLPEEQRTQARMNKLYGEWLGRETQRLGLPMLSSRPFDHLDDRVIAATA